MTAGPAKQIDQRSEGRGVPTASRVFPDGTLLELLHRPDTNTTAFAVWCEGAWSIEKQWKGSSGELLVPFSPTNNLLKNNVVLLPSEPLDYGNEEQLLRDIGAFIHRYADLTPAFENVAIHYVLLSWLYDAFNELPYLRLRGDFGTGKTRTLLTIGSLCYKAFFASGASTVSPIFHTLDAFRGTLIFDEADFRFSDERAEIVKVLNNGNVRGLPVLRTMINHRREFNPQAFHVFGPKVVATRSDYADKGLESRFLTEEMGGRRLRSDIPINLPQTFADEARLLRNKLLLYRFHTRRHAILDESLVDPSLEPRLNQILVPLLSVVRTPKLREELRAVAEAAQSGLLEARGFSAEAHVLQILADLIADPAHEPISVGTIAGRLAERYGGEYERPITNRWVGGILRARLSIRAFKSHGIYIIPPSEYEKVELLCSRYGIEAKVSDAESGDVGTSET